MTVWKVDKWLEVDYAWCTSKLGQKSPPFDNKVAHWDGLYSCMHIVEICSGSFSLCFENFHLDA